MIHNVIFDLNPRNFGENTGTHVKTWELDKKAAALSQVQVLFVFDEPEFDKQMLLEHPTMPKMFQLEKISNRTLNLIKYR